MVVTSPTCLELVVDERLEQLERHLLGKPALVQLELGADDDDRTARVVDALSEQVLTKTALLALEHIGERLERPVVGSPVSTRPRRPLSNSASTASWSMRFSLRTMTSGALSSMSFLRRLLRLMTRRYRSLRSLVAKRPPSSGTSGRSSGGMTGMTSRIIHSGRLFEFGRLDDLEALGELLAFSWSDVSVFIASRRSSRELFDSMRRRSSLIASAPISAVKLSVAVFLPHLPVTLLGEQLLFFERRVAGIDDDIGLEVEHALEVAERHVEQMADAAREALEEPDVGRPAQRARCGQALTTNFRLGDFDAALVADDAAVLHALVLAAEALPVGDRAEDLRTEQTIPLRLEGAVVDGLGLQDLAVRPGANLLRDARLILMASKSTTKLPLSRRVANAFKFFLPC